MFTRTIEPAFYDTDALGHINNTRLPAWFELTRNDLFKLFTPDLNPKKWRLIMARMEVDYRAELFYGHDIEIRTYLTRLGNSSFTVTQEARQHGTLTNLGHTVMVQYDHQAKCAKPIEGNLREALTAHLQDAPEHALLTLPRAAGAIGATLMAIRYNLWIDPDNVAQHRAVEADLEHYFVERFADYPHIRLFGADPYDYDAPFNRLYDVLMARAAEYCERTWCYVASPEQLNRCFFRAVGRSNKFVRDQPDGDTHQSGA